MWHCSTGPGQRDFKSRGTTYFILLLICENVKFEVFLLMENVKFDTVSDVYNVKTLIFAT